MEYKIVAPAADGNVKNAKIEKLGVVVNFTFGEIEQHEEILDKTIKELKGTNVYNAAKMTNIETNHPFVLTLSEQDLFTAHMYQEAKALVKVSADKISQIEKQLADYADEKAEIVKQIPELAVEAAPAEVVPSPAEPVPSPIQPEDLKS